MKTFERIGVILLFVSVMLLGAQMAIQEMETEELRLRVVVLDRELDVKTRALTQLEKRVAIQAREVVLLSDQCEVTLDLLVNTGRVGWWDHNVMQTLLHIRQLRDERMSLQ